MSSGYSFARDMLEMAAVALLVAAMFLLAIACLGGAVGVLMGSARLAYEWVTR